MMPDIVFWFESAWSTNGRHNNGLFRFIASQVAPALPGGEEDKAQIVHS